ncbi:fimbrial biogenesis outer membrane usher protein [Paraburkholderia sediminicola]|uniref:Fimbrial biogenesis outer membrane usher protein n=1 Tax=Paraburkholderia rhynchosiae TaxID=487049 RepID=A0ACC7N8Q1_9BURK
MSSFKVKALVLAMTGITGYSLSGTTFAADALPSPASNTDDDTVIFNDAFLYGAQKVDVSRFSKKTPLEPGKHLVDIYLNNNRVSSTDVLFVRVEGQDTPQACFPKEMLTSWGLDLGKLDDAQHALFEQGDGCARIAQLWPQASSEYDGTQLRLNVEVPQIALSKRSRGFVDPSLWDQGVPLAFANYNYNTYLSSQPGFGQDGRHMVRNDYLNVNSGINLGPIQLRSNASYTGDSINGYHWQNQQSYLQASLPKIKSRVIVGQSFTSGQFFDSIGYTGGEIVTDERMIPDAERGYAPVIRGVARTQAKVTVRQGGYVLLETSVPPGPFELDDLFPTGYGGDLQVTVTEADGSVQSFAVPYASVPNMLREGQWRYSATAGQLRDPGLRNKPMFSQFTYSRGVNNFITAYGATQFANNYFAALGGMGVNTPFGAVTADVTMSHATLHRLGARQGMSLKLTHSYLVPTSDTSISVAAYRYSTGGYLTLNQAAYLNDQIDANGTASMNLPRPKSRFDLTLGQPLGTYGQLYVVGSTMNQWDASGQITQLQLGYSNTFKRVSYSLNFSRVLTGAGLQRQQNSVFLSLTIPLGDQSKHTLNSTTNLTSTGGSYNVQTQIFGTALADNSLSYGAHMSYDQAGAQTAAGVNVDRQFRNVDVQAAASQTGGYRQYSAGLAGSVVAHPGGVTLGHTLGESFAVVDAPGAQGAKVLNANNTYVGSSGYAIVPYLSAFRMNEVMLSPEGLSPDIELKQTSQTVAPYAGAGVLLKFATQYGRGVLLDLKQPSGKPIPAGADVYDQSNDPIGVFGQGSRAFVRSAHDAGTWTIRWGESDTQQCTYAYALPKQNQNSAAARAMTHVTGTCMAVKGE